MVRSREWLARRSRTWPEHTKPDRPPKSRQCCCHLNCPHFHHNVRNKFLIQGGFLFPLIGDETNRRHCNHCPRVGKRNAHPPEEYMPGVGCRWLGHMSDQRAGCARDPSTENPPDRPPMGQQIQKMLLSFELSSLPSFQVTSIMWEINFRFRVDFCSHWLADETNSRHCTHCPRVGKRNAHQAEEHMPEAGCQWSGSREWLACWSHTWLPQTDTHAVPIHWNVLSPISGASLCNLTQCFFNFNAKPAIICFPSRYTH